MQWNRQVTNRTATNVSPARLQSLQQSIARILESEFERRQRTNKAYSIRAFARDLDFHPGSLHGILRGSRLVPRKKMKDLLHTLSYSASQIDSILESIHLSSQKDAKTLCELAFYEVIAEWEHYAILTLMDSYSFQSNPAWIAARLGITPVRTGKVLQNLIEAGLVSESPEGFAKCQPKVRTSDDQMSQALRFAHSEELVMAQDKMTNLPVGERDMSSTMICMPRHQVGKAKKLIREFRQKFAELCEDPAGEDIYQMCVQFFPLSNIEGAIE